MMLGSPSDGSFHSTKMPLHYPLMDILRGVLDVWKAMAPGQGVNAPAKTPVDAPIPAKHVLELFCSSAELHMPTLPPHILLR